LFPTNVKEAGDRSASFPAISCPDVSVTVTVSPGFASIRNWSKDVATTSCVSSTRAVSIVRRVERRYERYVKDSMSPATTSFNTGDLIRVTAVVTLRGEGRYLALTDPLPAGFEPLEKHRGTAATDDIAWFFVENGLYGECEGNVPCYVAWRNQLDGLALDAAMNNLLDYPLVLHSSIRKRGAANSICRSIPLWRL
jgi:hypothetical protein